MPANLENSAVLENSGKIHRTGKRVFIPIPKKGNAKECANYHTIAHISHASKVMLKILQARLQKYVNCELPDVQARFRKGRGIRDQVANITSIIEKAREFQKNIYFCFIDYAKAFDCVKHNKLWKILQEKGIPGHLTCLLRNLYAGQEATVRTGHGTMDWFQIGENVHQVYTLSICLFKLYAERVKVSQSCPAICNPMDYTIFGILQARMLGWVAVSFQVIVPTQGSNPGFLHCGRILYQLSHQGSFVQSTLCEMTEWMKHKLASRQQGDNVHCSSVNNS